MAKKLKSFSSKIDDLIHPWELIDKNMYEIIRYMLGNGNENLEGGKDTESLKTIKNV